MTNYFHILGLNTEATTAEIRAAYRNLAKQFHPDVNPSAEAKSQFIIIQEAYEVLSDPTKKENHLRLLRYKSSTRTSAHEQALRERIYEQWVYQQHREQLKRKVAEMREKQRLEEETKNFSWYYFGTFKVILYLLAGFALVTMTVMPLVTYFTDTVIKKESGKRLIIASIIGASFLCYFIHSSFIANRRKRS